MTEPKLAPTITPDDQTDNCVDWTLAENAVGVWLTVGNYSVRVGRRDSDGRKVAVSIAVYERGYEAENPLDAITVNN